MTYCLVMVAFVKVATTEHSTFLRSQVENRHHALETWHDSHEGRLRTDVQVKEKELIFLLGIQNM
jgi:hypothetical protein